MKITVKPTKTEVNVRKPDGTWLADAGEEVTRNAYWLRRIKDGDVEVVEKTTKTATTKTASSKTTETTKTTKTTDKEK